MDALYREYILDHYKSPRNFGELEPRDAEFFDIRGDGPPAGGEIGSGLQRAKSALRGELS